MNRAGPALLLLLLTGMMSGCSTSRVHRSGLHPLPHAWGSAFSEALETQRQHYVWERSEELVRSGTFATKDAARDFARYEWSQQYNNARTLSGEGFQSVTVPVRSPKQGRKEKRFRRDLAELDLNRP